MNIWLSAWNGKGPREGENDPPAGRDNLSSSNPAGPEPAAYRRGGSLLQPRPKKSTPAEGTDCALSAYSFL
jgi:hypothetical protein